MRKILFAFASACSLLLFLATLTFWGWSLGHFGSTTWMQPERYIKVQFADGVLGLQFARDNWSRPPGPGKAVYGWFSWRIPLPPGRDRASLEVPSFNRFGFGFHEVRTSGPPSGGWQFGKRRLFIVFMPFWLFAVITSALPLRWLALRRRQRAQNRDGYCASCGYNLTGNVTGICPECGATAREARTLRSRRTRRARHAIAAVAFLVLVPIVGFTGWKQYQDHLAHKKMFVHQEHYFDYAAAPDLIVYTEDPLLSQRLIAQGAGYVTLGDAACYVQKVLTEPPMLPFGNGPPTLFIHGRRSPDGTRMLVLVSLMALEDAGKLTADTFAPETDDEPGLYRRAESQLTLRRLPHDRMTFLAGQPDPKDESHFTIQYRLNDQPGTIDGRLADDGSVQMIVRDGGAQALPAPLKAAPVAGQIPKNSSQPTTRKNVRTEDRKE